MKRTITACPWIFALAILLDPTQSVFAIQTFTADPGWTALGNTSGGNNYGYSGTTNHAGGATGEAGGTFARSTLESYYADTNLAQSFNLNQFIQASGKFDLPNTNTFSSEVFIGHISSSAGTANASDRYSLGFDIFDVSSAQFKWRVSLKTTGSDATDLNEGVGVFHFVAVNTDRTWSYLYDPNLGANGRLSVTVSGSGTFFIDLTPTARASGATFDAFGIGIAQGLVGSDNAAQAGQVFIDDVTYSGMVPEPTSFSLIGIGLIGLSGCWRRCRR